MGLTNASTGLSAVDSGLVIKRQSQDDLVVAIAGNPNVGKSTVFNGLTGMKQHTGNWPGKTVTNAQGYCRTKDHSFVLVDIPGTYSLMAHSAEEEVARNFICFADPDAVVVVCDATCLERNLNLVLQTLEICSNVVVCVNLLDEARRKNIKIDLKKLSDRLGVPVIGTVAQNKKSLNTLLNALDTCAELQTAKTPVQVKYPDVIENAIAVLEPVLEKKLGGRLNSRWLSLKLLDPDLSLTQEIENYLGDGFLGDGEIVKATEKAGQLLYTGGVRGERLKDMIVSSVIVSAQGICDGVVTYQKSKYNSRDRRIDKILTGKRFGYPVMILLLALVFWLTISGANYPSALLSEFFFGIQDKLTLVFNRLGAPEWLHGILVLGIYRTLAWVVSVMLPPMAIFFPLFTLLEDAGYLPRIAYNLDRPFKKCNACGKQALTMCMGFGCNAAGVVGCRIIDSPRERLLAILTNSFVPCNGRFPTIITVITMFFVAGGGLASSALSAIILTAVILCGIFATFAVTKLLSVTVLKGVPSSYTLEMPPYRKPQIGKVVVRSIFDRTLFVLGRSAAVAAPAGMIIWLAANITVGDSTVLAHCAGFLDPFARLLGLDGVILIAFILGFPANEIVIPIIIMAYMSTGSLTELSTVSAMRELFAANGWTWVTAVCFIIFSLMHWPCSTTLITIKKETGSLKWTALAAVLPTLLSIIICMLFNFTVKLFA